MTDRFISTFDTTRSAVISNCGSYRYELRRVWDAAKPALLFICLNPSTADASNDDNTARVCVNYARRWGFGTLLIGNLFAIRATHPKAILRARDPIGPGNDRQLQKLQARASLVICAWGDAGAYRDRDQEVLRSIAVPHCLTTLKSGRPGHPLYKRADLSPVVL